MILGSISIEKKVAQALKDWHAKQGEKEGKYKYFIADTMPSDGTAVEIVLIDAGAGQAVRGTLNVLYYFRDGRTAQYPKMPDFEALQNEADRAEACAEELTNTLEGFIFSLKSTPRAERLRDVGKTMLVVEFEFAYSNLI